MSRGVTPEGINSYSLQTDPFGNKFKREINSRYYKNANDDKDKTKYYFYEFDKKFVLPKFYYIKKSNLGLTKTINYITELIRQDNQTPLKENKPSFLGNLKAKLTRKGGKRRTRRRTRRRNKKTTKRKANKKTKMKRKKTHKRKTNKRRRR